MYKVFLKCHKINHSRFKHFLKQNIIFLIVSSGKYARRLRKYF